MQNTLWLMNLSSLLPICKITVLLQHCWEVCMWEGVGGGISWAAFLGVLHYPLEYHWLVSWGEGTRQVRFSASSPPSLWELAALSTWSALCLSVHCFQGPGGEASLVFSTAHNIWTLIFELQFLLGKFHKGRWFKFKHVAVFLLLESLQVIMQSHCRTTNGQIRHCEWTWFRWENRVAEWIFSLESRMTLYSTVL